MSLSASTQSSMFSSLLFSASSLLPSSSYQPSSALSSAAAQIAGTDPTCDQETCVYQQQAQMIASPTNIHSPSSNVSTASPSIPISPLSSTHNSEAQTATGAAATTTSSTPTTHQHTHVHQHLTQVAITQHNTNTIPPFNYTDGNVVRTDTDKEESGTKSTHSSSLLNSLTRPFYSLYSSLRISCLPNPVADRKQLPPSTPVTQAMEAEMGQISKQSASHSRSASVHPPPQQQKMLAAGKNGTGRGLGPEEHRRSSSCHTCHSRNRSGPPTHGNRPSHNRRHHHCHHPAHSNPNALHHEPQSPPSFSLSSSQAFPSHHDSNNSDALSSLVREEHLDDHSELEIIELADSDDESPMPEELSMCVFNAAPLVFIDGHARKVTPVSHLDGEGEKHLLRQLIAKTSAPIHCNFHHLTLDNLSEELINQPDILHLSGHGLHLTDHSYALALEHDNGSVSLLSMHSLSRLLSALPLPKLVVILACHSEEAARVFTAAGCQHVIAVKTNERVLDRSAKYFTKFFYAALFSGQSIRAAFEIGKRNVEVLFDNKQQQQPHTPTTPQPPLHTSSSTTTTLHTHNHNQNSSNNNNTHTTLSTPSSPSLSAMSLLSHSPSSSSSSSSSPHLLQPTLTTLTRSISLPTLAESDKFILLPTESSHDVVFFTKKYSRSVISPQQRVSSVSVSHNYATTSGCNSPASHCGYSPSSSIAFHSRYNTMITTITASNPTTNTSSNGNGNANLLPAAPIAPLSPTLPPVPSPLNSNLPSCPNMIVGREIEVQRVISHLLNHRLVNVYGAKKAGKTSVALLAAHYMRERGKFTGGVYYISFSGIVGLDTQKENSTHTHAINHTNTTPLSDETQTTNATTSTATIPTTTTTALTVSHTRPTPTIPATRSMDANQLESCVVSHLCYVLGLDEIEYWHIRTYRQLFQLIRDFDILLLFDDCLSAFTHAFLRHFLLSTNRCSIVCMSDVDARYFLSLDSGISFASVEVGPIALHFAVLLLRRLCVEGGWLMKENEMMNFATFCQCSPYEMTVRMRRMALQQKEHHHHSHQSNNHIISASSSRFTHNLPLPPARVQSEPDVHHDYQQQEEEQQSVFHENHRGGGQNCASSSECAEQHLETRTWKQLKLEDLLAA